MEAFHVGVAAWLSAFKQKRGQSQLGPWCPQPAGRAPAARGSGGLGGAGSRGLLASLCAPSPELSPWAPRGGLRASHTPSARKVVLPPACLSQAVVISQEPQVQGVFCERQKQKFPPSASPLPPPHSSFPDNTLNHHLKAKLQGVTAPQLSCCPFPGKALRVTRSSRIQVRSRWDICRFLRRLASERILITFTSLA